MADEGHRDAIGRGARRRRTRRVFHARWPGLFLARAAPAADVGGGLAAGRMRIEEVLTVEVGLGRVVSVMRASGLWTDRAEGSRRENFIALS